MDQMSLSWFKTQNLLSWALGPSNPIKALRYFKLYKKIFRFDWSVILTSLLILWFILNKIMMWDVHIYRYLNKRDARINKFIKELNYFK